MKIYFSHFSYVLLALFLTSCGLDSKNLLRGITDTGTVGVKTVRQLNKLYTDALIKSSDGRLNGRKASSASLLPPRSRIEYVSPPSLLAAIALGSAYCERLWSEDRTIADGEASSARRAYSGITIRAGNSVALFDDEAKKRVVLRLAELLWQKEPHDDDVQIIVDAMSEVQLEADKIQDILLVGCTLVASSIEALTL